jgi:hypothetical protein
VSRRVPDESKRKRARKGAPPQERVLLHVAYVGDCWEWTAKIGNSGYGRVTVDGRVSYAHRFSYEAFVGPVPEGLQLDHLCRNTVCVRPDHLEPVTPAMNTHRSRLTIGAINAAKRDCKRGHPFDEVNTYITTAGRRVCRTCRTENIRRFHERRALAAANIEAAA